MSITKIHIFYFALKMSNTENKEKCEHHNILYYKRENKQRAISSPFYCTKVDNKTVYISSS